MIPIDKILDALRKVDWKKVGDVAEKTAKVAAAAVGTIVAAKTLKGDEGLSRKAEKEIERLDRMLRKGIISEDEYQTMRQKIVNRD